MSDILYTNIANMESGVKMGLKGNKTLNFQCHKVNFEISSYN